MEVARVAGGIIELHVLKDIYCSNKHTIFSYVWEYALISLLARLIEFAMDIRMQE